MKKHRLLVATRNPHKLREAKEILSDLHQVEPISLDQLGLGVAADEHALEAYPTFAENAAAKAQHFAARAGLLTIADDSGLCVDALGGLPGVHSKRFSGQNHLHGRDLDAANNRRLLERLEGVPAAQRTAHYVCAVAAADSTGLHGVVHGRCDGIILAGPRGTGGFGYDPLFFLPCEGVTFGELPASRKNRISHRANALRAARQLIRSRLDPSSKQW